MIDSAFTNYFVVIDDRVAKLAVHRAITRTTRLLVFAEDLTKRFARIYRGYSRFVPSRS
jgi:hypothetical protein